MRIRQKASKAKIHPMPERLVLTLELPQNSRYYATCSGRGGGNPTRIALKVAVPDPLVISRRGP